MHTQYRQKGYKYTSQQVP